MITCPVCGKVNSSYVCPQCRFDASRHYEAYPTLQSLPIPAAAISALRAPPSPPTGRDDADTAMKYLRTQGWDQSTLDKIEAILLASKKPALSNPQDDPEYVALINALVFVLRHHLSKMMLCLQTRLTTAGRTPSK